MAADIIQRDFTRVYNRAIRDKRISRRARGLLVEMMSHQDGFGISMAALIAGGPEKKDALQTALWELEKYGYLHRDRARNELGQLGETLFFITDMPDGMSLEAPAPWSSQAPEPAPDDQAGAPGAPEPADPQNRRSEPGTENPPLDGPGQTPRSEPKTDFPAQGFPAQGNPPHKKTTSSSRSEKTLSPPADVQEPQVAPAPRTREIAASQDHNDPAAPAPADNGDTAAPVPAQRAQDMAASPTEQVLAAYEAALGGVALDRAKLLAQAEQLLAVRPLWWVVDRARELPQWGDDLKLHAGKSKVPFTKPKPAARPQGVPPVDPTRKKAPMPAHIAALRASVQAGQAPAPAAGPAVPPAAAPPDGAPARSVSDLLASLASPNI
ncbi:hypothetical protein OG689_44295 [Kitasatospora sp. NBC_00240]|uniref:hypothetical protein n=1 Tax=Kitasatospora sp. NBC_00240 TaxID=2903567 RepID=UPI00224E4A48|nr:hypothetical protein [Kitasatospora sp. NBC_00240]MCX5216159.1 hypothetical protein [Kitasatospora sp. NBC_00240]